MADRINLQEALAAKGLELGKDPVKLDVGSGDYASDDSFLSVDAYTKADINALMWDLPLEDETVDTIFCCQAMEHISKFEVIPTLREFRRVLKPGGRLQIIVPDLEWCAWWWLTHQGVDWSLDILYGHQLHEGEYHRTGYTVKILKDYIDVAGGFELHGMQYLGGDFLNINFTSANLPQGTVHGRSINAELTRI